MTLTVANLAEAMQRGVSSARYAQLLPAVNACLIECDCTTVERAAMWFGQVGEESGGLKWMEEIASGAAYEGRTDLGNTQPGDGVRYKGRGPIQVTGRHNYTGLSQWAFSKGYVPTATYFVDHPDQLSSDQYGFIGVTWYWTTQRPMNDAADAKDIVRATKYVNGGTNGLADRTQRWQKALGMGTAILPDLAGAAPVTDPNRPDFNEINEIGLDLVNGSYQHASTRSQPPKNFFLHTQQPTDSGLGAAYDSAATDLSAYLRSTSGSSAVSYHYTIRQATDGGVTVVDVVDTDMYAWAVLNANVFSINLCFAGSKVEWTRDQWMTQSKAIDVAAYLAVQDAAKYNFSHEVIKPPYGTARQGISDHKYVTQCLGIGNHTDVGNNFPWDFFEAAVLKYAGTPATTVPVVTTPVPAPAFTYPTTDVMIRETWEQLRGPQAKGWSQLNGRTLVDAVAELLKDKT